MYHFVRIGSRQFNSLEHVWALTPLQLSVTVVQHCYGDEPLLPRPRWNDSLLDDEHS